MIFSRIFILSLGSISGGVSSAENRGATSPHTKPNGPLRLPGAHEGSTNGEGRLPLGLKPDDAVPGDPPAGSANPLEARFESEPPAATMETADATEAPAATVETADATEAPRVICD